MNELTKVFNYQNNEVRTVVKDGEPWFVAKDVCEILGLVNVSMAVNGNPNTQNDKLADDEKGIMVMDTPGGKQNVLCVNEYGLYSLMFKSRKAEALAFRRWITHEVLPTIRKTGGYVANEDMFISTYLPTADEATKALFRGTLATLRQQNEKLAIMQPKADYFDALVDRNLLTNLRDTAKELKVKERDFINWLISKKYVYRDLKQKIRPYAEHIPELFEVKEWGRNNTVGIQTLITPRGRETFRLLLDKLKEVC